MPDLIQGLIVLSLLEVQLPLGVVGVGRFPNLDVTTDGGLAGLIDMDQTLFPMFVGGQGLEKSFLRPRWSDVLSIDPATRLVSVATYGPFPERLADPVVDALEDLLADNVSVVVGPAPDDGVETVYQSDGRETTAFGLDNRLHLLQESLLLLLGWRDEEFSIVLAEGLSQKVETIIDVGDGRLGGREPQPAFRQKFLHQGQHPFFQCWPFRRRDDEVG